MLHRPNHARPSRRGLPPSLCARLTHPFVAGTARSFAPEAGNTLISVIVAVAILAIGATMAARGITSSIQTKRGVTASAAYREIDQAFQNRIWEIADAYVKDPPPGGGGHKNCRKSGGGGTGDLRLGAQYTGQNIGAAGTMTFTTEPDTGGLSLPEEHRAAQQRCRNYQSPNNDTDAGDFYFCLQLEPIAGTTAPTDSFLSADYAFAEIYIGLKRPPNFQTGGSINCEDYRAPGPGMGAVYYAIYWAREVSGREIFKQHSGTYYAAKKE